MDARDARDIRFIQEKDGPIERRLITALGPLFVGSLNVERAYLALASIDQAEPSVVLAIRGAWANSDAHLVQEVGKIFASILGGDQFLDVMFLSEVQEQALSQLMLPFYRRSVVSGSRSPLKWIRRLVGR